MRGRPGSRHVPFHLYKTLKEGQPAKWFGIRIEFVDDRWVSTCREVDAEGNEKPDAADVAPRFYGMTAEQARRRMVDVISNTYDEVTPVSSEAGK